ncbi:sialate O-acetylesterase [Stenotrophomonas sp. MMGLT7]|uniref:sialate O-acetylesterase n=1 Tax=Stenotrophomonas sp. MMGLT7 TaxID=2901227 RepID=UPI001E33B81D|nr:sialate O-acetylesterase [Stenotrophomonas sp. MMGLT7]MCD7096984.1 hypothetical protein [Stenotrophomonas sp. MMGLT7]
MTLNNKVDQFIADSDLAHRIVHGGPADIVQTKGGLVKSYANAIGSLAHADFTFETWAELNDVVGEVGKGAQVWSDAGTHTDPVTFSEATPNSGSYVWSAAPAGWKWVRSYSLASISEDLAQLKEISGSQTIGKQLEPTVGTTQNPIRTWVLSVPLSSDGVLTAIRVYASAAGEMKVHRFNKNGDVFTRVGASITIALVSGLNEIPVPEYFPVEAGQYIGFYSPSGILRHVNDGTDPERDPANGYYDSGSNASDPVSFTDASPPGNGTVTLQVGFDFISGDVLLAAKNIAVNLAISGSQTIGKQLEPTVGTTQNPIRTWVLSVPLSSDGVLTAIRVYASAAGEMKVHRFNKNGDVFTRVGASITIALVSGLNEIPVPEYFPVEAGQYIGFYSPSGILRHVNDGTDPERDPANGYYDSGSNASDPVSFTDASPPGNGAVTLQIGFDFVKLDRDSTLPDIVRSVVGTSDSKTSGDLKEITGYILVWAIGQSNTSGRAIDKSSIEFNPGQAYKYVRSTTSLELLADPTGNDSTAVSGGGRGSWGPAFAGEIRRLSSSRIGTIIVNSAEGGSSLVSSWASAGRSWTQAQTDLANALARAAALNLPIIGCCVYMQQGETDADNAVSAENYISLFKNLKGRVDSVIGTKTPFLMTRIGTKDTGDTAEYAAIRAAQNSLALTENGVFLIHTGAKYFAARGLMMDTFHYMIQAYEEIGTLAGNAAFGCALGVRPLGVED